MDKETLNNAAPDAGATAPETTPETAPAPETTADATGGAPETTATSPAGGGDDMAFMQEFYNLLRNNPELANRIADTIEEFFSGGGQKETAVPPQTTAPQSQQSAPADSGLSPAIMAVLQALDGRLSQLERHQANMELDRELAETKKEYEKLKEHFPILPELSDNEILQIAVEREGLPLKDALYLWAVQKLMEGDGTVADRLVAAKIEQSKGKQAPPVESKGGGIPAGTQEPPTTFREARRRAKEFLATLMGGPMA